MRAGEQHSYKQKETEISTIIPDIYRVCIQQLDAHFRTTVSAMEHQMELMTQQNELLKKRLHRAESTQRMQGDELRRKEECLQLSREEIVAVRVEANEMMRQERAYWTNEYQSSKETEINELLQYIEELQGAVQLRDEDIWKLRYANQELKCLLSRMIPKDQMHANQWQSPHGNDYVHQKYPQTRAESYEVKGSRKTTRQQAFTEKHNLTSGEIAIQTLVPCDAEDLSRSSSNASISPTMSPNGTSVLTRIEASIEAKDGREDREPIRWSLADDHEFDKLPSHTSRLEVELATLRSKLKLCQEQSGAL